MSDSPEIYELTVLRERLAASQARCTELEDRLKQVCCAHGVLLFEHHARKVKA